MAKLEYCSGIAGIKNKKNNYLSVTPDFAKLFQYHDANQVRGLSELEIANYALKSTYVSGKAMAEDFILEDETVLRGQQLYIFEVEMVHQKLIYSLVHKMPYIENNKIEGTCFRSLLFPNLSKTAIQSYLSNPEIYLSNHTKIYLEKFNLLPKNDYNLTQRELQCIEYLCQGDTAQMIAQKLSLSRRTVEFYLRNIKDKLGVNKMTQIVALAISEELISLL